MNVIIKLELFILIQETICQYAPNQYYQHQFTQAAYYRPLENEEYIWPKRQNVKSRKTHKKRRNYNEYYISAEMDYGPKKLRCKCTCKKYATKSFQEYEQNGPCCPCDTNHNNRDDYDKDTPTQHPHLGSNGMFPPLPYPSMVYPTMDWHEAGKVFPWLTWGFTTTTKLNPSSDLDKDMASTTETTSPSTIDERSRTSKKDHEDKTKTRDYETTTIEDKDTKTTTDDRDKSTLDDKHKTTTKDDRDKTSTKDDRDKTSTTDDRDKTSTKEDRDKFSTKDDRHKTSTEDEKDKTSTKDDKNKSSTKDDRDKTSAEDDRDKTSTKEDKDKTNTKEESIPSDTTNAQESTTTVLTHSETTAATLTYSTSPYTVDTFKKKLKQYFPKKKSCLRDNCLRKDKNRKVGRYYEDALVERPTVASYLNGNGRRSFVRRNLYGNSPRYGIIPIPDKLAMKFMKELQY